MAGVAARPSPAALARTLSQLPVRLSALHVESSAVPLPDYADGPRPSSVLVVEGAGQRGMGENVAFYPTDHQRFTAVVHAWFASLPALTHHSVESALAHFGGTGYERAALEAALIDLGMRQAERTLHDLTGVRDARLRFVASLAAETAPERALQKRREAGYAGQFKLDVSPTWDAPTRARLALDPSIAIFDFKGRGGGADALAFARSRALLEDPPSGFQSDAPSRISRDASLSDRHTVRAARDRGEAVNLKAPRMGGPLELLFGLEHALSIGEAPAYLGGMFEVAVGRTQARQLAALYCADGPNDLASNRVEPSLQSPPLLVRLDLPGFGST